MNDIINPKLIITDLDATLVVKHQAVTPRAKRAIEICQKHGCKFGIASGRPLSQIFPSLDDWGIVPDVMVAFNGCQLYNGRTKEVKNNFPMKGEWIREVLDLLEQNHFEYNVNIVTDDALNYFSKDPMTMFREFDDSMKPTPKPGCPGVFTLMPGWDYKVEPNLDFYCQDNPKIMIRGTQEEIDKIDAFAKTLPQDRYKGFKTGPAIIEFANANVSKAFALQIYCDDEGINIKDVIGMGDTSNDNDLLAASGYGVCMCNGTDDTKAVADFISELPCDEDGWADFIERHVLIPNGWN